MKFPKALPAVIWLAVACPVAIVAVQRALPPTSVQPAAQAPVTAKVVAAANDFLATLNDSERARGTFGFTSSQRTGWSNLPTGIFQRNGLRFGDLTARQREAALALMAAALSSEGYRKVMDIMNGDEVLKNKGGGRTGGRQGGAPSPGGGRSGGGIQFGLDEYYLALLGTPSATAPWMVQFGGHHLAINVTVVGPNERDDAQSARSPAGEVHLERPDDSTARPGKRQGLRAHQCPRCRAAEAGDPDL